MGTDEILGTLRQHYDEITKRFDVKSLSIFGSVSRNEAKEHSDVDILVEFQGEATFRGYFGLKFYLETLLQRPVDLVTNRALKDRLRPYVEKELIRVA